MFTMNQNWCSPSPEYEYGELLANNRRYFSKVKTAILSIRDKNPHPFIISEAYADGLKEICEFDAESEAIDWINGIIK